MSAMFNKQNDNAALTYLKAYKYCSKQKRFITYFMIAISLAVTLGSIAIKSFGLSQDYSTAMILISGVVLIVNIFCSFLEKQYNIEAVNMLERYDVYVFNLPVNKSIMRPIAEQSIVNYARKFKNIKKIRALRNYYFKTEEQTEEKNIRFNKLKRDFAYEHRLLINVHVFFMMLWIGYVAFIMSVAVLLGFVVKDSLFIDTLTNIFVPALSTISLIAAAWKNYSEQFRRLTNAVAVTNEMLESSTKSASATSLDSPLLLRQLQDTMFVHRQKSITIPEFLIRRFDKKLRREEELLNHEMFIVNPVKQTRRPSRPRAATSLTKTAAAKKSVKAQPLQVKDNAAKPSQAAQKSPAKKDLSANTALNTKPAASKTAAKKTATQNKDKQNQNSTKPQP